MEIMCFWQPSMCPALLQLMIHAAALPWMVDLAEADPSSAGGMQVSGHMRRCCEGIQQYVDLKAPRLR